MRDTIYRESAIDELYKMLHDCFWADDEELDAVITTLNNLPSAQTTQTDTSNTLKALDCVERQAAIDALKRNTLRLTVAEEWNCEGHVAWDAEVVYSEVMEGMLLDLPSAQPNLQPTCNNLATDTISRQAAIDALEKWESESTWDEWCYDHKDEAEKYNIISPSSVVFGLPSALPDTQWIPCGPETMPKKTGYYLVQYTRKYCRNEMAVAFYSVKEARCDDDYTWEIETFSDIKEVIAWMPLPESYREEGEQNGKN